MVAAIEEVKKVLWDGGHGGKDPGSSGNGVVEKNIALQVATEAAKRLEQEYEGVQCLLSRSTDSYLSLKERTDKANAAGAHLLVSIHCNAGGGKGGFESFTYSGTKDAATAAFQDVLHSEIMKKLKPFGVIDRGQKKKDLHVCRESRMPAVLTENLFVDVAADAARLKRPEVIEAIVAGHVAGVAKYLKLQPKKAQQPPASGATNILGPASATVEQAREWARSKNAPAEFVDLAELYWELAPKHGGVDPAVAYVQFGHETGYLYRDGRSAAGIDASYKNPCGLKVTAGGGDYQASAHKRFTDWREGITAHLELCKKYATEHSYKVEEVFLDHGFSANSERPEFENVRKFMDENPNGTLIVSSYDRLERDSMKMYEFCQNIKEVNYNVVSANNNDRSFKELELICGIDKISKEQKASE